MSEPAIRWTLTDGRELLLFALPGHTPAPVPDRRPLRDRGNQQSQLRFDRQTGQWVIIAALRQDRTYKPPPDQCPLCPGPSGVTSEIPAPDYDVAVFENRFPSLSGAGSAPFHLPTGFGTSAGDLFLSGPGHGRCEVICFSSDHTGSLRQLELPHARLVVDAWRHRTADLMAGPGVAHVFCFENRGEEIGVTLTHPHGQIYGYPYLPPRAAMMLREARAHAERTGGNLFTDILAHEVADGSRIIARTELFTAFVPFAARWPVEVHIYRRGHPLYMSTPGLFTQVQPLVRQPLERVFFANTDSEGPESTTNAGILAAQRAVKEVEARLAGKPMPKEKAMAG